LTRERIIAVIPARGGSKGVPRKNVRKLAGKPSIAWAIELAKAMPEISRVIVSTDDGEIGDAARAAGAEVYDRPAHLATDAAMVIDALRDLHARLRAEGETARCWVLLETTAPLRTTEDVRQCIELLLDRDRGFDCTTTFHEAARNPYRAWRIDDGGVAGKFFPEAPDVPRQKLPTAYFLNGNAYCFWVDRLGPEARTILNGRVGAVVIPQERGFEIDEPLDFEIVDFLMSRDRSRD